jgi:type IV secretory pathway VirB10-like protein
METLKKLIFKESMPFTNKKDLNTGGIAKLSGVVIFLVVLGLLLMPTQKLEQTNFREKVDSNGVVIEKSKDNDPTNQTLQELKASQANLRNVPKPNQPYATGGYGSGGTGGNSPDRNTTMIISRSGVDTKNALTAGTRVAIKLSQSLTISTQTIPVMGLVSGDVISDNSTAIPEGSRVIGDASFDDSNGRANLVWKTMILPDGRERPFAAVSVGNDNQVGVSGNVRSNAIVNTVGQMLTQFVGAYAQGSMSSGMFGASSGGVKNGIDSAVAQTAKERANSFGEDLKKEKKWIEIQAGTGVIAILSQSFVFREPGAL